MRQQGVITLFCISGDRRLHDASNRAAGLPLWMRSYQRPHSGRVSCSEKCSSLWPPWRSLLSCRSKRPRVAAVASAAADFTAEDFMPALPDPAGAVAGLAGAVAAGAADGAVRAGVAAVGAGAGRRSWAASGWVSPRPIGDQAGVRPGVQVGDGTIPVSVPGRSGPDGAGAWSR